MKLRLIKWEDGSYSVQKKTGWLNSWWNQDAHTDDIDNYDDALKDQYWGKEKYPRELANIIFNRIIKKYSMLKEPKDKIAEVIWKQTL